MFPTLGPTILLRIAALFPSHDVMDNSTDESCPMDVSGKAATIAEGMVRVIQAAWRDAAVRRDRRTATHGGAHAKLQTKLATARSPGDTSDAAPSAYEENMARVIQCGWRCAVARHELECRKAAKAAQEHPPAAEHHDAREHRTVAEAMVRVIQSAWRDATVRRERRTATHGGAQAKLQVKLATARAPEASEIPTAHEENMARMIQCGWRCAVARHEVARRKAAKAAEDGPPAHSTGDRNVAEAMVRVIQSAWRDATVRRERRTATHGGAQAKLQVKLATARAPEASEIPTAHEESMARMIQCGWRCAVARYELERRRSLFTQSRLVAERREAADTLAPVLQLVQAARIQREAVLEPCDEEVHLRLFAIERLERQEIEREEVPERRRAWTFAGLHVQGRRAEASIQIQRMWRGGQARAEVHAMLEARRRARERAVAERGMLDLAIEESWRRGDAEMQAEREAALAAVEGWEKLELAEREMRDREQLAAVEEYHSKAIGLAHQRFQSRKALLVQLAWKSWCARQRCQALRVQRQREMQQQQREDLLHDQAIRIQAMLRRHIARVWFREAHGARLQKQSESQAAKAHLVSLINDLCFEEKAMRLQIQQDGEGALRRMRERVRAATEAKLTFYPAMPRPSDPIARMKLDRRLRACKIIQRNYKLHYARQQRQLLVRRRHQRMMNEVRNENFRGAVQTIQRVWREYHSRQLKALREELQDVLELNTKYEGIRRRDLQATEGRAWVAILSLHSEAWSKICSPPKASLHRGTRNTRFGVNGSTKVWRPVNKDVGQFNAPVLGLDGSAKLPRSLGADVQRSNGPVYGGKDDYDTDGEYWDDDDHDHADNLLNRQVVLHMEAEEQAEFLREEMEARTLELALEEKHRQRVLEEEWKENPEWVRQRRTERERALARTAVPVVEEEYVIWGELSPSAQAQIEADLGKLTEWKLRGLQSKERVARLEVQRCWQDGQAAFEQHRRQLRNARGLRSPSLACGSPVSLLVAGAERAERCATASAVFMSKALERLPPIKLHHTHSPAKLNRSYPAAQAPPLPCVTPTKARGYYGVAGL